MIKVGIGIDCHPYSLKKIVRNPLILGGVLIDKQIGVIANSDGDIVIHSLCNAINTALGQGSFGAYADLLYKKGIHDSGEYLKIATQLVNNSGYVINNIACMIEAGTPRLEQYGKKITASLGNKLRIPPHNIGIAFTSGNGLSVFSKGKGIKCTCIVSLIRV